VDRRGHVVIFGSRSNELSCRTEEVTKFSYIQLKSRTLTGSDQTHALPQRQAKLSEVKRSNEVTKMARTHNMQILHECRDSRHDHFAERRYLARRVVNQTQRKRNHEHEDDFTGQDITEEMILEHLEGITERFSFKKAASHKTMLECYSYLKQMY
jgi:hypothetical protein